MKNEEKTYDLIKFEDGDFSLDVKVSPNEGTVWLTQKEMSLLFEVDKSRISRHIKNIFEQEELDNSVVVENATTGSDGKKYVTKYYNLDMVIAVGYKVNSRRGTLFRKWADSTLNNTSINDDYNIQNMPRISERFELLKFEDGDFSLDVNVSPEEDTVWLTANQMA